MNGVEKMVLPVMYSSDITKKYQKILDDVRNIMRGFYRPLKAQSQFLRFAFITGITKFSQMSIFSELNNLNVISMDPEYETICGITEDELLTVMRPDIENLAKATGMTFDDTVFDEYTLGFPNEEVRRGFADWTVR